MNRFTPMGVPRVVPTAHVVGSPDLFRAPVLNCNTCRFERTPLAQSPCNACSHADLTGTNTTSQWRPK